LEQYFAPARHFGKKNVAHTVHLRGGRSRRIRARRTRCQQAEEQAAVVFEGWTNLRSPQPSQTISAVQDERSHEARA
jgi:hypothetical protein